MDNSLVKTLNLAKILNTMPDIIPKARTGCQTCHFSLKICTEARWDFHSPHMDNRTIKCTIKDFQGKISRVLITKVQTPLQSLEWRNYKRR